MHWGYLYQLLKNTYKKGEALMDEYRLTTIDNPYDPFDDFTKWYLYDLELGHNTTERLARFTRTSDSFTDKENNEEISRAIDEIIINDPENIFVKLKRTVPLAS